MKILVCLDLSSFSSTCAQYAIYYARFLGARLHVLHVAEQRIRGTVQRIVPELSNRHCNDVERLASERLFSSVVLQCERSGVDVRTTFVRGNPESEIVRLAADANLVMLGQKGFGANFTFGLQGRTIREIVKAMPQPLIVTPATFRPLRSIIVAFDDSPAARQTLNAVLEFRSEWKEGPLVIRILSVGSPSESGPWLQSAKKTLAFYNLPEVFVRRVGNAGEQILLEAAQKDSDMIALGTSSRSQWIEFFVGSTVNEVLNGTRCPLFLSRAP